MAYTTINKPSDYFNTVLWTGNGSTQSITGVGFQPDLNWSKKRTTGNEHALVDAVRGATKTIYANLTNAEGTQSAGLTSFDSDGFSVGTSGEYNDSSQPYAGWNWLANGAGSSNTDGDVTATISANQTSGFSIVKYTNPSSGSPFTVGHGLGSAPKMIIIKNLSGVQNWGVWHTSIGFGNYLILNLTNATGAANLVTATSSTTFSTYQNHHSTGVDLIAYCFAEKKGFSKFGSYTGNGNADGTFIYLGFRPAWFLWKRYDSADSWNLVDSKRAGYNVKNYRLFPNTTAAEDTQDRVDLVSNGVKIRTSDPGTNASGGTYIYMAFAEHPLVSSTGVPCTAR